MIDKLLPAPVVTAEAFDDAPVSEMFPEEWALVSSAVPKRQKEFGTVRRCARSALSELGIAPAPLLPGPQREPLWPAGIVGAMTHCAGYRAAAVARSADVRTVGLDAEPHLPVDDPGVIDLVTLPEERAQLRRLAGAQPEVCWDRLVFSAKESVYKAWYPLAHRWLGFEDALLTLDPSDATFTARLLVPGPVVDGRELTEFSGRWLIESGLVVTAIVQMV
ncbi:4'-phosphopantetheinyl transferase EntD (siderophore biosynthesis) [Streptomyces sp. 2224.1]|uniref:4'-phosphopantetheinyl transferase family protein n=1 Tax=unclassified Streptomyces TaxID=2593676 RepID=UPI00088303AA|nr:MULTISPECIES: 4'-phosphopantetheinyl transferase superfamily protein [unclassified Streptomyces]PBC85654.1 4'-phosphopantetheinyl transferase EntD [Streptomyces sp. 2321.6]SDR09446.1 4'-phosphopantetheinyl transferase EntD (siderophore biosynthesis) [Streptomyces sp. KS_16]SED75050.1 4'-phosphopantetheinyl transferase EntD (siderophore biosynthesis) [Streptomyces sp. 2133.1]SEE03599.1 4'-phosphopantetheinyl transferase EntD (siderophore biosynthesis) [Streptomyces sp. 2112.3]SEE24667.1 4'-p